MDIQKVVWILEQVNGFGIQKFRYLSETFKDLATLFEPEILGSLSKIPEFGLDFLNQIQTILDSDAYEKEIECLTKEKVKILSLFDSAYPKNLASIYDPPLVLYVKGNFIPEDEIAIAIVGSRHATSYGFRIAGRFAEELAEKGVTIISGFARGIDAEAHRGAIRAKGRTIAVLGCGLDVSYPNEHRDLYEETLSHNGVLISEYPLGMPPLASNFPRRNRIISGLAMGVLVVEANKRSGSLITARLATEEGREVYAVPGPIDAVTSSGTNDLIREGAKLVTCVEDILEDLVPQLRASLSSFTDRHCEEFRQRRDDEAIPSSEIASASFKVLPRNDDIVQDPILNLLTKSPLSLDEIAVHLNQEPKQIHSRMTELELKGSVRRVFGGSYIRNGAKTKVLQ